MLHKLRHWYFNTLMSTILAITLSYLQQVFLDDYVLYRFVAVMPWDGQTENGQAERGLEPLWVRQISSSREEVRG